MFILAIRLPCSNLTVCLTVYKDQAVQFLQIIIFPIYQLHHLIFNTCCAPSSERALLPLPSFTVPCFILVFTHSLYYFHSAFSQTEESLIYDFICFHYSSLLPYLPMLMDPLVSALNGTQTLVSQVVPITSF